MDIYAYDDSFRNETVRTIAGVDEVGRGPIAGPLVAAAAVLPPGLKIDGVRDSKKIPEKERKRLFYEILCTAPDIGVGIAGVDEIERYNVLGATRLAMQAAVSDLAERPDMLLIDAVKLPSVGIEQVSVIKGDTLSASVAAASIVAKVVRDSIMIHYHGIYPEYGFDRHKGYGTSFHLEAIGFNGPCPLHRKGFKGVMSLKLPFQD
jgi:ribonuclease HII